MKPLVVLNLKAYQDSIGEGCMKLCSVADEVAGETGAHIIVAPPPTELARIVPKVKIHVYGQHAEPLSGAYTGAVTWEALKAIGATGSIVNHSERRATLQAIGASVSEAKRLGMSIIVCTTNADESRAMAALRPSYIAVEPPELIGSGVSVSTAKPEIVVNTVAEVRKVADVPVLCGAGVSNGGDVKKALELGAQGVLLASAYTKAKDPKAKLLDLVSGL